MNWFENLTGFREENPDQVRANLSVDGNAMTSQVNGRKMICGTLETPNLAEFRSRAEACSLPGKLRLAELVGDVANLHQAPENAGAVFQVASQFNLLEMISPSASPEDGVAIYAADRTQGPACAISAGAGTIYRNYFAPVHGRIGQTQDNQIDCLADLGSALGNTNQRLWRMKNGYALAEAEGLKEIANRLAELDEAQRDDLRKLHRIGAQWDTEVTIVDPPFTVTQTYCSAMPVSYCSAPAELWSDFAMLVLEAAYEATFCAALINAEKTGNKKLFLTLLGGGVFGNREEWIFSAIRRAVTKFRDVDLDVALVSYGRSKPSVQAFVESVQASL